MPEVKAAQEAWNKAPAHVRVMGSAYVGPILAALEALALRVEALEGGKHGE